MGKSGKSRKKKASANPVEGVGAAAESTSEAAALLAEESAAASTRSALQRLFEQMLAQQEGVKRGEDPEAVHDFRVAIRRTRSALGQVRGVFPPYRCERFRENFAWLARESNALRDIDVLLEELPKLAAEVCPEGEDELAPLREFLLGERVLAHQALCAVLRSERYRRLLRSWRLFLDKPPRTSIRSAPNAERPVGEVARERLLAVYRRAGKKARRIEESSPATELHELRIDCKKLRYLLELFRFLFDAGEISAVLAHLKQLQDVLGELNDLEVQKEMLYRLASAMAAKAEAEKTLVPATTLLAMGRIAQRHVPRQAALRKELERRLEELTRGEARAFFRALRP